MTACSTRRCLGRVRAQPARPRPDAPRRFATTAGRPRGRRTGSDRRPAPRPARPRRPPGAAAPPSSSVNERGRGGVQRVRRAGPSASYTAARTSGCGNDSVQGVRGPGAAQQVRAARPRRARERVGDLGERRGQRHGQCGAEHGGGVDQSAGRRRSRRSGPAPAGGTTAATGSGCSRVAPRRRRELLQQRPGVQRVALRAVAQPAGRDRAERSMPSCAARSRRSCSSSPRSRRTVPRAR